MMRISLRSLGTWLRPLTSDLQQRSSVCSTCQALATLHRQQLQRGGQHQQEPQPHPGQDTQQRRRLQLYSAYFQRAPESPGLKRKFVPNGRDAWTYKGPHGVDHWAELYGKSCSGKFQSPVDLNPNSAQTDSRLDDFVFLNFDNVNNVEQTLENNGHTVQVSYKSGDLRVSGGGLRNQYRVVQYHFHWGSDNAQGSEHTVKGKHYPMEMHVVTYNMNYDNFSNALNYADGLAVLGAFIEVEDTVNQNFVPLTDALPSIKEPGSSMELTPVSLELLLPADSSKYYRYQGGLTTPPCSEVVTWTVFRDTVSISNDQIEAFRSLQSMEKDEKTNKPLPMVDNYRPTQPLHGREIKSEGQVGRLKSLLGRLFSGIISRLTG